MNATTTHAERIISRDAGRTAMAKPFDRYKPEVQQPVRKLEVKGTEIEKLRQAREMLRSMTPEQVKQIIEFHQNLTFFEALLLAKQEGKLIIPNDVHDRILTETSDEKYLKPFALWTGTVILYGAPNKPFGGKIVFAWEHNKIQYTITFNVPKEYQGKKNCALVIDHPDFDLVKVGGNSHELRVADESNIHLIKRFPKENDWYLTEDKYKIPVRKSFFGRKVNESNKNARYLWRPHNDIYLGSIVRAVNFIVGSNRLVNAGVFWSVGSDSRVAMIPLAAVIKETV